MHVSGSSLPLFSATWIFLLGEIDCLWPFNQKNNFSSSVCTTAVWRVQCTLYTLCSRPISWLTKGSLKYSLQHSIIYFFYLSLILCTDSITFFLMLQNVPKHSFWFSLNADFIFSPNSPYEPCFSAIIILFTSRICFLYSSYFYFLLCSFDWWRLYSVILQFCSFYLFRYYFHTFFLFFTNIFTLSVHQLVFYSSFAFPHMLPCIIIVFCLVCINPCIAFGVFLVNLWSNF